MVTNVVPGSPRGRGGWTAFRGAFTRQYLIDNGPSSPTDIHQEYRRRLGGVAVTTGGAPWRLSTSRSFQGWFSMAARLGLIARLPETEEPKGDAPFLNRRTLWAITDLGRDREDLWVNVQQQLYPIPAGLRRDYSTAARERRRERKAQLEAAGISIPRRGRRPAPPAAVAEDTPVAPPRRPGGRDSIRLRSRGAASLQELLEMMADGAASDQSDARDIVRSLANFGVQEALIDAARQVAESRDWTGDATKRRQAQRAFQTVGASLRRLMGFRGSLS